MGCHPLCVAIENILLPYEYSQKSSAHSHSYQTLKACDIYDIVTTICTIVRICMH